MGKPPQYFYGFGWHINCMATHSSTLAWEIPWTEDPGRLQYMGSQRVRHNWATSLSLSWTGEGNGNPLHILAWRIPGMGAWQAAVYGVAQVRHDWRYLAAAATLSQRRRQWHPTPVLLPGKSYGWRNLVGCSPWGRYELDTTERLHFHFSLSCIGEGNGNPLQCSWPGESQGRGSLVGCHLWGRTESDRLKQFGSSSSSNTITEGFPGGASDKEPNCQYRRQKDESLILGSGRSPEEGMATHSSILAWRIPCTEEPGKLQSMGSQRDTMEVT